MTTEYGSGLLAQHAGLLATSAISPAVAHARGYRSVTAEPQLEALGFAPAQRRVPTLLIPIRNVHGRIALHQHRPDKPRIVRDKALKYETPKGSRLAIDVPPTIRDQLADPGVRLLVTEGARKADAAVTAGLCCIALLGVWGWRGKNVKGGKTALPDWESIALKNRRVLLGFDSDVTEKPEVRLALERLSAFLALQGAVVRVIYLPPSEDGGKVGLDDYLAAGHTADELLALATELRAREPGNLPRILVSNRPLRHVSGDAEEALEGANIPPVIFVRGGALARVRRDERGRPIIDTLAETHLRGRLARVADFVLAAGDGERHVSPPLDLTRDILALGEWLFPALEAVVEVPVLRLDGSVLDTPGYDPQTKLIYVPESGLVVPTVVTAPTQADAIAAGKFLLDEIFVDFPFVDDGASRTNAVALAITPIVRPLIVGPVPLALLDKPQPGTGASLLADIIALITTGRAGAMMSAPRDDEEWRKAITSALLDGSSFILIDNVVGVLRSAALAKALTATTWKDRLLGKNVSAEVAQRAVWAANGNNLRVGNDIARRGYWVRVDAKMSRPWQRKQFRHRKLRAWVLEHRGDLLAAILTMVRGWIVAGRPAAETPTMGGFEEWVEAVGAILEYADIKGFLRNADRLYEEVDEEGAAWGAFLAAWFELFADRPVKVADIEKEVRRETVVELNGSGIRRESSPLCEALPPELARALESGKSFAVKLGNALRAHRDQVIGDLRLEQSDKDTHAKVGVWRVLRVHAGTVPVDPRVHARARGHAHEHGGRPAEYPQDPASPAEPAPGRKRFQAAVEPGDPLATVVATPLGESAVGGSRSAGAGANGRGTPADPYGVDAPKAACRACGSTAWWQQDGGAWVCGRCHPPLPPRRAA